MATVIIDSQISVTICYGMNKVNGYSLLLYLIVCFLFFIDLSTGRNIYKSKVVYIWISPDIAKAKPTLRRGVIIICVFH